MFGTLKAPLHGLRGTAGMTGLPHDAFDTLKAPLRGLRGTAAHLAYEEPTGFFASRLSSQAYGLTHHTEAPASLHSRHVRHTQGTAAQPSRHSSQAYCLTCHMEAPCFSSCADLRSQIRVAYGSDYTEESSSVAKYGRCTQTATHKSHWRSSMRRPNGNRHTRDRVSVAVCGQRPKRATTDQRPTSMVASRAA